MRNSPNVFSSPKIKRFLFLQQDIDILRYKEGFSASNTRVLPINVRWTNNASLELVV